VQETKTDIDGIPARIYDPGAATGVLLLGHGHTQSKDDELYITLGRQYASETGLAVACIDAVNHGERATGEETWAADVADRMVADWQRTADHLADVGPPVAYVGFSMGMIFGAPTVAAMPTIKAAVFGVGGIPTGMEPDRLLGIAARLAHPQVLMLNMTKDDRFSTEGTHAFFDAIPGRKKRLMFWEGAHSALPSEAVRHSIAFVKRYAT
jgi:dienelactone hydrolase